MGLYTNASASLIRNTLKSHNLRVLFLAQLISFKNEILLNYFENEKNEKIRNLHDGVTALLRPKYFSTSFHI